MEINRNNYEVFFLMYVDQELSATERKIVDVFVSANPDLAEELVMLQQSRFMPDPAIVFEEKHLLLVPQEGSRMINHTNYEEYFLLYVDNELTQEQRLAVEQFSAQNERLQKEFSYLLQSRVEPDAQIVFDAKDALYKREKDTKRIIIPWFRVSAAACLLLIAGWLVSKYAFKQPGAPAQIAKQTIPEIKPEKKNMLPAVTPGNTESLHTAMAGQKEMPVRQPEGKLTNGSLRKKQNESVAQATSNPAAKDFVPAKKAITDQGLNNTTAAINPMELQAPAQVAAGPVVVLQNEPSQDGSVKDQPDIKYIALNNMNPDSENGFSVLTTSSGKSKMRGFFRKVSRVFEKTTRVGVEDESKAVLIGNFQIALK